MRVYVTFLFWLIVAAAVSCLLLSCGLVNHALGTTGAVPAANTQGAVDAAQQADASIWQWLGSVFFGVSPETAKVATVATAGALAKPAAVRVVRGAKHVHRVVKHGLAAVASATPGKPA
jgi:hypothetical protein